MRLTAITIGDVHLADKTPASRLDNYRETLFEELMMARKVALEEKADVVLITGDIFDVKSPKLNSHYLVSKAISLFSSFPCPVYSIIGNHDITANRIDSLDKQPLAVLFNSGALKRLDKETINGVDILGIHFNENNSYETLSQKKQDGKPLIAVCHVLASPTGGDMFGEPIFSYKTLASSESEVDVYVFGHYHHDQGIQKIGKKSFVNIGSLARGALSKENVDRQVKVGKVVWDGKKFECSEIPLPVKSGSEIFNIEKKQEIEHRETEIEKFVSTLNKTDLFENISTLEETIKEMRLDSAIRIRVTEYLNNRGAGINV